MDERESLKSRISMLQTLYVVLFVMSLVLLLLNWTVFGHSAGATVVWAISLGGAVLVRIYRSRLVNRYNQLVAGGSGPLV